MAVGSGRALMPYPVQDLRLKALNVVDSEVAHDAVCGAELADAMRQRFLAHVAKTLGDSLKTVEVLPM